MTTAKASRSARAKNPSAWPPRRRTNVAAHAASTNDLAAFDLLPTSLRQLLADGHYPMSVIDTLALVRTGLHPESVAVHVERGIRSIHERFKANGQSAEAGRLLRIRDPRSGLPGKRFARRRARLAAPEDDGWPGP